MRCTTTFRAAACAATLGVVLAACGTTSSATTANSHITIGFVVGITSDPFFITMENGANADAAKR